MLRAGADDGPAEYKPRRERQDAGNRRNVQLALLVGQKVHRPEEQQHEEAKS
jgi:hypothetical protein